MNAYKNPLACVDIPAIVLDLPLCYDSTLRVYTISSYELRYCHLLDVGVAACISLVALLFVESSYHFSVTIQTQHII